MRLATLRRSRSAPPLPGLHGTARVWGPAGRRLRGHEGPGGADLADLARRIRPGDIAVIDRLDLDAGSARLLVAAGVAAVVNASPTISGRYPALGARLLVANGVLLLDRVGPEVLRVVGDGDRVRLDGNLLHRGDDVVVRGEVLDERAVEQAMDRAQAGLAVQLEAFAGNTAEYLRRERDLFLDGEGVPPVEARLAGRPVVVVSRGPSWRQDLTLLRAWMRSADPVVVGVDEGADALLSAGVRPDLVVGNPELMSEAALLCGAEVVVRADRDGRAGGAARAEAHGARTVEFPVTATSEDAALLLADAHGAALIVVVGSRASVVDFADRARADMAGTFLTRLKVGTRLVDAATVAQVYRAPAPGWPLWLLVVVLLAGILATGVLAGDASPVGEWRDLARTWVTDLWEAAT